jgi:DNA-binding NarL/FixJ family response regulator
MRQFKDLKILLVEDHHLVREAFRHMLLDLGVGKIVEASNGRDSIEMAKNEKPDLILMDLMLPIMNGMEASREIRKFDKDIKILAVTIHSDEQILRKSIACGIDGLLLKSSEAKELEKAINVIMSGQKFIDSSSAEILFNIIGEKQGGGLLSPREKEILQLAADGYANKEIANNKNLAIYTVKGHWKNIFVKLGARDRGHAISIAFRNNLLE